MKHWLIIVSLVFVVVGCAMLTRDIFHETLVSSRRKVDTKKYQTKLANTIGKPIPTNQPAATRSRSALKTESKGQQGRAAAIAAAAAAAAAASAPSSAPATSTQFAEVDSTQNPEFKQPVVEIKPSTAYDASLDCLNTHPGQLQPMALLQCINSGVVDGQYVSYLPDELKPNVQTNIRTA